MTALVTINQGTAPAGSDGDTVRSAFTKVNANVTVLQTQAAITSATTITSAQALTSAHIGKRVNLNLATPGTINLPAASSGGADSVVLLRNIGTTVVTLAITSGSADTVALSKLNPGESALMDTDGVHTWSVLMRGRTNSDNETVNGNCTVNGNETVGGTLGVTGATILSSTLTVGGGVGLTAPSAGLEIGSTAAVGTPYIDFHSSGALRDQDARISASGGSATVDGQGTLNYTAANHAFSARPTFAGKTPWDNGNLVSPATLDTAQAFTGSKSFSFSSGTNFSSPNGTNYTSSTINLAGTNPNAFASIGFNAAGAGGVFRMGSDGAFGLLNFSASSFSSLTCSTVIQTSDRALKTDVTPQSGVLEKLRSKRTVSYALKSDSSKTRHLGVIAQEWQTDFPELVVDVGVDIDEDGDFIAHQYDEDGNEIFGPNGKPKSRRALGFNYANASAVALQGVIELQEKLEAALSRIAELETK